MLNEQRRDERGLKMGAGGLAREQSWGRCIRRGLHVGAVVDPLIEKDGERSRDRHPILSESDLQLTVFGGSDGVRPQCHCSVQRLSEEQDDAARDPRRHVGAFVCEDLADQLQSSIDAERVEMGFLAVGEFDVRDVSFISRPE